MNARPIGIFDSGVGGLTVLKEIFRVLPQESTIYLGDTARVPYGIRSPETVARYSFENTEFLVSKGIKLLVIACNTASAVSLEAIKERVSIPVIGVIEPGAKAAAAATKNRKIGIIGTEATINSGAYTKKIKAFDSNIAVSGFACPLFVPLVEEGITDDDIASLVAERYLKDVKAIGVDTLVLGCTHYPLLKPVISRVMGRDITLIDSAIETVEKVKELLKEHDMANDITSGAARFFYVTDAADRFARVGERFLGQEIRHLDKIDIGGI